MVSLGGRHFLKRYNEMADEPVDNVGNICIQIFLRIIRVISMKKIFLNGKMEDNLKEIDNKIYIDCTSE